MTIAILSGSHRDKSESQRVANYIAARLPVLVKDQKPQMISLANNPLPLWEEDAWKPQSAHAKLWQPYAETLRSARGLVIISPEWAGMVPPGLKNFLLHCSTSELAHKPALLVTVSAARGGTHPINELRISGYKNNKVVYLPEHIIIRNVGDMLVGDKPASKDDEYLRNRMDYGLLMLLAYAKALAPLGGEFQELDKNYPFGM
jgi:NAD(P)H-dependent FMN reductase